MRKWTPIPDRQLPPRISTLAVIPHGDAGTQSTLEIMARLVRESRTNPIFRDAACGIIADTPEKDAYAEASAIQEWVRDNIRYTADITDVETIQDPLLLLRHRFGDCDDKSVLVATLLQAVGHEVRFVAVAFDSREFTHVLAQVLINGVWTSVETTEPVSLGWFPPDVVRVLTVRI